MDLFLSSLAGMALLVVSYYLVKKQSKQVRKKAISTLGLVAEVELENFETGINAFDGEVTFESYKYDFECKVMVIQHYMDIRYGYHAEPQQEVTEQSVYVDLVKVWKGENEVEVSLEEKIKLERIIEKEIKHNL